MMYENGDDCEIGHVVKLKSSGPEMTVTGFCLNGEDVCCCWFPEDPHATSILQSADLPVAALERQR